MCAAKVYSHSSPGIFRSEENATHNNITIMTSHTKMYRYTGSHIHHHDNGVHWYSLRIKINTCTFKRYLPKLCMLIMLSNSIFINLPVKNFMSFFQVVLLPEK
jgi:hypothetical protein